MSGKPGCNVYIEYETEEIADYAVRLFSGLVTVYNRTLKFATKASPHTFNNMEVSPHSATLSPTCKFSTPQMNNSQVIPGVENRPHGNGYRSQFDGNNYDYGRRVFEATLDSITQSRLSCYYMSNQSIYPSYRVFKDILETNSYT